jgi:hypothetical protein
MMQVWRRARPDVSWGEAESAEIAELARAAAVDASGQRGVRVTRVDLDEDVAMAHVLLLEGDGLAVLLRRQLGRWRVEALRDG